MEMHELLKRAEDLARRSEQRNCLTKSGFLTPAERYALQHHPGLRGSRLVFSGGYPEAERTMAFFLPDSKWLTTSLLCKRVAPRLSSPDQLLSLEPNGNMSVIMAFRFSPGCSLILVSALTGQPNGRRLSIGIPDS